VKPFAIVILFLALVGSAQARLGEALDQTTSRFGKIGPLSNVPAGPLEGLKMADFEKQGVDIQILFSDVSVQETYRPSNGAFSREQIQVLLDANSEGQSWTETQTADASGSRWWTRKDGATASLNQGILWFKSKFLLDREKAWQKAQLPDVKGF
jgi:hypothetical protein